MGSTKNSRGSHACRGKYAKKKVPTRKNDTVDVMNHDGSRIINLNKLQEHLQVISRHAATCQSCADNTLSGNEAIVLVGVKDHQGLCSILTSRCAGCHEEFQFATSSRVQGLSGGQCWECNLAAVWGQLATGGGHAPLTESMAVLGLPSLTKIAFMAIEKRIGDWWRTLLNESMKQAGEEEKAIALSKDNRYDIPRITVIVDGGWSKRAHKHSYNAKSGVGIIIGKETGKILFMGVRNKYCAVCHNTSGGTIPEHTCFLNWDQSSSAMETDIIVEGFCQSETQHGLHYTEFIGDGDSSVHPTLVRKVPYGTLIKKVECANHAVKCFRGKLESLVLDKPSYKGRGKLTEAMRKRLTKSARCAIMMWSQELNKVESVKKLQRDLVNVPLHCFGCHSKCSPDFCKTAQKNQQQTQEQRQEQQQQQLPPTNMGAMANNTVEEGHN
ncbi:uncharacterized protein [Dysidea avara]|uniref:uncharacterized protein n=1 Tax=Dysidea avara TaxID=196820 RepID=UPI00331B272C